MAVLVCDPDMLVDYDEMSYVTKPDKIAEVDMLKMRVLEGELENAKLRAELKLVEMQAAVDGLWVKYELKKGTDRINADGSIVRG